MLKKVFKVLMLLAFALGCTSFSLEHADASTKVMWGKTELKLGQIGKVTILANTSLVKLGSDGSLSTVRSLKKGEEFRVYSYKNNHGGLYGVGGGSFVQKNGAKVKYETPSKSKLALLKKQVAVTGGLAPKAGLQLTYFPNLIDKSQKTFVATKEPGSAHISLNFNGSIVGGYTYVESNNRFTMGVNETDWTLFDFGYPMTEGKQTKEYYLTDDWEQAFNYINVESTTSTITVKAGTFKNVVIIRSSGGAAFYFAPGYGVIKVVGSDGKVLTELISVQ
ncbi:hypothetical protein [Psychrobacillus sp.]|uniref:hypothetical protein n=1 Tax=Psychrobacillus sp. TaxID=1871623 RepID=UPI0028BE5A08|nr:hypothetical protein [Psychrobacillus sp.]